jgi:prepilin-type processing-associated H-X9-DG protein
MSTTSRKQTRPAYDAARAFIARAAGPSGISLVELLVAMAIISALLAIMLPAVQAARESGRAVSCRNNLRQQALALLQHEAHFGRYPSNGWGYLWQGDSERGTAADQPGGWVFSLRGYFLGGEATPTEGNPSGAAGVARATALTQTSLDVFRCPSRPGASLLPQNTRLKYRNAIPLPRCAKTDYAICEGDVITYTDGGPPTLSAGDRSGYRWTDVRRASGICFLRSTVAARDVEDGLSHTYAIGEKYVHSGHYHDSGDLAHDQSMYSGVDWDIARWVVAPPAPDQRTDAPRLFGSAHRSACNMAFCDGRVSPVSFSIDAEVHRRLGNRLDGLSVEAP